MNVPPQFALIAQFKNALWMKFQQTYQQLALAINGNISFGQVIGGSNLINGAAVSRSQSCNIDGVWANVTTPNPAGTSFTVTHNLGRTPSGWIIMQKTAAVDIFIISATTTQITFQATVANITIFLFII